MKLRNAGLVLPILVITGCMDRPIATAPDGALGDIVTQSVTHTVQNTNDFGAGSLRAAIQAAGNGHVIAFDPSLANGTIELSVELVIDKSLTIVGPEGGITISGNNATRIFRVLNVFEVVLDNLTLRDGAAHGGSTFGPFGGAILNLGNLTVRNSRIQGNWAQNNGGAIENTQGSLTILNTTISNNGVNATTSQITVLGGGIHTYRGTVAVANSTISGNTASSGGGGISNFEGTLSIIHGTIANNGASAGGGIYNRGGIEANAVTELVNTIVAGNVAGSTSVGPDIHNFSAGSISGDPDEFVFLSASHSLVGQEAGHSLLSSNGNLIGIDPKFELDGNSKPKLAGNGGPTSTHALLETSPAIAAAHSTPCASEPVNGRDQRGVLRPQGAGCDIGAFELTGAVPPPPPPPDVAVSNVGLDASGTANKSTGAAVISGIVTCSVPGLVELSVELSQEQKQRRLSHTVLGNVTVSVSCDGPTAWAAGLTGSNGLFVNGDAHAAVQTLNVADPRSDSRNLKLFWSK